MFCDQCGGRLDLHGRPAHNEFVAGTTYTDSFTVATADGTTTVVTVNIAGTNDAAVISAATRQPDRDQCGPHDRRHADHHRRGQSGDVRGAGRHGRRATACSRSTRRAPGPTRRTPRTTSLWPGRPTPTRFTVATADGTTSTVTVNILGTNDAAVIIAGDGQPDRDQRGPHDRRHADHQRRRQSGDVRGAGRHRRCVRHVLRSMPPAPGPTPRRPAHNEFVAGTTYTDSFTVATADGTTSSVTVNIPGTNDAAVITAATRQPDRDQRGPHDQRHADHHRRRQSGDVRGAGRHRRCATACSAINAAGRLDLHRGTAHNEFVAGTPTPTASRWPRPTAPPARDGQHPGHQRRGGDHGRRLANLTETNAVLTTSGTLAIPTSTVRRRLWRRPTPPVRTARSRSTRRVPGPTRGDRRTTSSWPAPPTPTASPSPRPTAPPAP